MKKKSPAVLMLSTILIAGVLLDGIFYSHAQNVRPAVSEQSLCETIEEAALAEETHHSNSHFFVTDLHAFCTDRKFARYVDSVAGPSADSLHDWIMPLRI
jgi:hypothetical protein